MCTKQLPMTTDNVF